MQYKAQHTLWPRQRYCHVTAGNQNKKQRLMHLYVHISHCLWSGALNIHATQNISPHWSHILFSEKATVKSTAGN